MISRLRAWLRRPASPGLVRLSVAAILVPFTAFIFTRFRSDLPGGPFFEWSFLACLLLLFVVDDIVRLATARLKARGKSLPAWVDTGVAMSHLGFAPLAGLLVVSDQAGWAVQGLQWLAGMVGFGMVQVLCNLGFARLLGVLGRFWPAR